MKEILLEIALRYTDNSKEANDMVDELMALFCVKRAIPPVTDDIIAQAALDYLKEVGSVDKKNVIYHDFTKGANWYKEEIARRQAAEPYNQFFFTHTAMKSIIRKNITIKPEHEEVVNEILNTLWNNLH